MSMSVGKKTTVYDTPDRNTATARSLPSAPGGADPVSPVSPEEAAAWQQLLLLRRARNGNASVASAGLSGANPAAARLFDLYLPLCTYGDRPPIIGHLGQSLEIGRAHV